METNAKLFRAIVILGAALTAPACDEGKCPTTNCLPTDATASNDGRDPPTFPDGGPIDADPSDVILIL